MPLTEERLKLEKTVRVSPPKKIVDACLAWARRRRKAYGKEFDRKAVERMVRGSWQLRRFLKLKAGDRVLEVGPFFNPQVDPKRNPGLKIVYWENERGPSDFLAREHGKKHRPLYVDLNKLQQSLQTLDEATRRKLAELSGGEGSAKGRAKRRVGARSREKFDAVIVSHVFNYINFRNFLYVIKNFMRPGGVIYVNNVPEYGLPTYFSRRRPKSNDDVLAELERQGFRVIEAHKLPKPRPKDAHHRLIVVAKLAGKR